MHWTDERIELLKARWADGLSATKIATEFGDVTRNAVIGKVARLGLSGRDRATAIKRGLSAKRSKPRSVNPLGCKGAAGVVQAAMLKREQPTIEPDAICDLPADQSPHAIPLTKTKDHHCRWPLTAPTADMLVCGAPIVFNLYCARHAAIAYQPRRPA